MTRPLGRKPYRSPGKIDHHVRENHRKVPNWWEVEVADPSKAAERRGVEAEIQSEMTGLQERSRAGE